MTQEPNSLLASLTKPKGVLAAAALVLGGGLLLSVSGGGDSSVARDVKRAGVSGASSGETAPAAAGLVNAAKQDAPLANEAVQPGKVVRMAAADKPTGSFTSGQRDEIGKIVREYLLKNPTVLEEVSVELQKIRELEKNKKQKQALVTEKKSIFRSPHDFVLGNPDGDITLVEYFDYNCGWCKRALDEVTKVTKSDKNVRVVMKEFPIFGADSAFAAKVALASIKQNKYWDVHVAMMKAKRVTKGNAFDIAKSVGVDVAALKKEMANPVYDKVLAENSRVAQALGMQGTPGFVVDSRVNYGFVPADGLKQMLAEIRKEGCKIC